MQTAQTPSSSNSMDPSALSATPASAATSLIDSSLAAPHDHAFTPRPARGMTLIQIMIVIGVIGIIGSLAFKALSAHGL